MAGKEKETTDRTRFSVPITYVKQPAGGMPLYHLPPEKTEPSLQEMIDRLETHELLSAQKEDLLRRIREKTKPVETEAKQPEPSPKRYLVDPDTGRIDVAEDGEGDYSHKDALLVSASIKQGRGQFAEVAELLKALQTLREERTDQQPQPKKEFYVDEDSGIIVHDPENGEYTMSEARAISASRQRALVAQSQPPFTPETLELWKRDIQDDFTKKIATALEHKEESPLALGEDGGLELNRNARNVNPLLYYLLHEFMQSRNKQQDTIYRDSDGRPWKIPEYLEVKRFEREEDRKDRREKEVSQLLAEARKELPRFAQALKGMTTSRETQESLKKGGWQDEGTPPPASKTALCAQCSKQMEYSSIPSLIACPGCGALNFFGSPEQFAAMQEQLAPVAPTEEKKEEQEQWEAAPEPESPASSPSTDEATPKSNSEPESPPTSEPSPKKESEESI